MLIYLLGCILSFLGCCWCILEDKKLTPWDIFIYSICTLCSWIGVLCVILVFLITIIKWSTPIWDKRENNEKDTSK